ADWGVLIHEGRFTFGELGLDKVADLGQLWEAEMGLPIPLGAIFASNRLDPDTIKKVERTIARSTIYALNNRTASAEFVRSHAGELSPKVLEQHIDYFVTDFTRSLSERGRQAIATLLAREAPTK
ncbi:MAG: MqnA/MqnD/SBP family protein, partial [Mucinivorans sp.]